MSETGAPHVLHISTPRGWRGSEKQIALLLEELKARDWPVSILCRRSSPMRRFCHRHRIESIPFEKRFFNRLLLGFKLYSLCRKRKFDILHVHDQLALSAAIFGWRLGLRIPIVVSRWRGKPSGISWLFRRQLNHPAVKVIICASGNIRNELLPLVKKAEKLVMVPAGIDTEKFVFDEAEGRLRREYFLEPDHTLVGNTSALARHKDYDTFLKTAKNLLSRNPKMFFLAIGDGPDRHHVEKMIGKLELGRQVKITGSRNDMNEVVPQLDLLLYTPLVDDLGISVLEAFVAGVPVVATSAGCLPELIEHEKNGLLAPVGDAEKLTENVMRVISDDELRNTMIKNGFEKARHHSRKMVAESMLKIYTEVLSKKG